jgi:hypothetical protein
MRWLNSELAYEHSTSRHEMPGEISDLAGEEILTPNEFSVRLVAHPWVHIGIG